MERKAMICVNNRWILTIKRMNFKTNCAPQRRRLWRKRSKLQPPIHPILFFQNIHDGDEFAVDVVTMGGPVERPVKICTTDLVLDFFLTHAPFAVSLQDAMAIILKRSQEETF
jgi:hypothetical protein